MCFFLLGKLHKARPDMINRNDIAFKNRAFLKKIIISEDKPVTIALLLCILFILHQKNLLLFELIKATHYEKKLQRKRELQLGKNIIAPLKPMQTTINTRRFDCASTLK